MGNSDCRIAASGGDKRFRQSRLGSDAADNLGSEDEEEDFPNFDKPTRIEQEGSDVDPDPGDRDSVSLQRLAPIPDCH